MKAVACTLISGDYHIGAAALANSLYRGGYQGTLYVFYRGPQPHWPADGTWTASDRLELGRMSVRFVIDDASQFIALRKPACLHNVFALDALCGAAVFIDADVVIRATWERIENWLSCGIAVCVDGWMQETPSEHNPLRTEWRRTVETMGRRARTLTPYFNSGFVGVQRSHGDFLNLWQAITDQVVATGRSVVHTHTTDRTDPFFIPDQDAMNAALMGVDTPISALGTEGMGFSGFGTYMTHFATHPKPWAARYLRRALQGLPPSTAERQFWDNATGPIYPLPTGLLHRRRLTLAIAKMIGRFYARPAG